MSRAGWPEKCPGVVCRCSFVDTVSLSPLTNTEVTEIRRRWTDYAALLEALRRSGELTNYNSDDELSNLRGRLSAIAAQVKAVQP